MTTLLDSVRHAAPTLPAFAPPARAVPVGGRRPAAVRIAFASGANAPGEILGFAAAGIAPGVAAPELRGPAITALRQLAGTGVPVFVDSGAFSEVKFGPEGRQVVAPITDAEWRSRLALYQELATNLGAQLTCVAPDAVGDQDETLIRLATYREEIRALVATGARVLVPVQKGARSQIAFWAACVEIVGPAVVPALPMKKAATTPDEALRFIRSVQPTDIHLLGFGLKNRGATPFFTMLSEIAPQTSVTVDANLITASVGRDATGAASRGLTAAQDAIREARVGWNDTCLAAAWGLQLDYTELASLPSIWMTANERRALAATMPLSAADTAAFLADPDAFLQTPVHRTAAGLASVRRPGETDTLWTPADDTDDDACCWHEEPMFAWALDLAYQQFVQDAVVQPRKALAITRAFRAHPAAGQFPSPPTLLEALHEADALFEGGESVDAVDAPGTVGRTTAASRRPHRPNRTPRRSLLAAVPVATLTATADPVRRAPSQLGLFGGNYPADSSSPKADAFTRLEVTTPAAPSTARARSASA